MTKLPVDTKLYAQIVDLLRAARRDVVRKVNHTMVFTYSEIGRMIVEEEQNGQDRAEYGRKLIQNLSKILTKEFGKGFSVTNIQQMRNFYLAYQKQQTPSVESGRGIQQTLSADSGLGISAEKFALSWSHYLILMVKLPDENSTIGIVFVQR